MIAINTLLILVLATFGIGVVGSLAGLVLGNLRLPLLLLVLPPSIAAGTNVTISGAGAGAGVLTHLRAGRFDRQAFLIMTPPSIVGAIIGGYLSGLVPGMLLVVLVAGIVLEQGIELTYRTRSTAVAADRGPTIRRTSKWAGVLAVLGFFIGILGGLVGLILGTIRLPALLRAGISAKDAVATNLAVGFFVGIAGLIGHLVGGTVDLFLVLILVLPAVGGGVVGARLSGTLSERNLKRAVGFTLIAVAVLLIVLLLLKIP